MSEPNQLKEDYRTLITLFAAYIISSLKQYIRSDFNSFKDIFGICILAGVIGYCVAGIFTDSVVSVAPVFWALLGLGIAVNRLAKKEPSSTDIVKRSKITV